LPRPSDPPSGSVSQSVGHTVRMCTHWTVLLNLETSAQTGFNFWQGQVLFLPALGPTHHPIQWVPGVYSQVVTLTTHL
jgi:hypothetical protein